jgi:hypothetical protein
MKRKRETVNIFPILRKIKGELKDAIFQETIKVPIVLDCGHVFECEAITEWIKTQHVCRCPTCSTVSLFIHKKECIVLRTIIELLKTIPGFNELQEDTTVSKQPEIGVKMYSTIDINDVMDRFNSEVKRKCDEFVSTIVEPMVKEMIDESKYDVFFRVDQKTVASYINNTLTDKEKIHKIQVLQYLGLNDVRFAIETLLTTREYRIISAERNERNFVFKFGFSLKKD